MLSLPLSLPESLLGWAVRELSSGSGEATISVAGSSAVLLPFPIPNRFRYRRKLRRASLLWEIEWEGRSYFVYLVSPPLSAKTLSRRFGRG